MIVTFNDLLYKIILLLAFCVFKVFRFSHIDVSGLSSTMTRCPQQFLRSLWLPSSIDLSPLVNIRSIAPQFLSGCRFQAPFTTLDLNFMTKLENIDHRFMERTSGVVCVDMSKLTRLKFIGPNFLVGGIDLEEVKLPVNARNFVSSSFLWGCKKLRAVNLQSIGHRKEIPPDFLFDCARLKEMDLSHCTSLTKINAKFMTGCSALQTITLPPTLQVSALGDNFLSRCSCLRSIDLSFCAPITTIPANFMVQCKLLQKTIDLTPLSNVVTIENTFLLDCYALTVLDFSPMVKVESLGRQFLSGCLGLQSVNFSGLGAEIATDEDGDAWLESEAAKKKKFMVEPFFMGNGTIRGSLDIILPPPSDNPASPHCALSVAIKKTKQHEEDQLSKRRK